MQVHIPSDTIMLILVTTRDVFVFLPQKARQGDATLFQWPNKTPGSKGREVKSSEDDEARITKSYALKPGHSRY